MRYFGPRPLTANNSARSQSTLLWNARVGYRLEKNLRLTADVLNLFNRRANDIDYFYQSQLRGEAAAVTPDERGAAPKGPASLGWGE